MADTDMTASGWDWEVVNKEWSFFVQWVEGLGSTINYAWLSGIGVHLGRS
jgi:hypothetical protein